MATLIAVHNSEGCVGRCDARCYGATHEDCNCVCGGINHGVGEQKARNNTYDMIEQIQNYCEQTYGQEIDLLCKVNARQLELFPNL